jgi:hypothetical protein
MAYKQNNPLSRTSSSPLFRKQGVSPINNKKSNSPLNFYPTKGTFAGSIEEAERLHAPRVNEEYVDIGVEGAPVYDLQTRLGNIHFGSGVTGFGTDDQEVNFINYKDKSTDTNPNAFQHPLGRGDHNYRKQVIPVKGKRPNPSMYPLGAGSYGGTSTDVLDEIDDYGRLEDYVEPSVNPFRVGSIGGGTHEGSKPGLAWGNRAYTSGNYYTGDRVTDDYRNTPWKYASEQFGDGSGPNLPQEGMTTLGYEGSPAIYPFFSDLSQTRAGNVTDKARGEDRLLTKNFNSIGSRGITNRANVRDAFSTYVNRNTMNPDELFSWDRSAPRPGTNLQFSDQFKTEFPQMLAGGTGVGDMPAYEVDNNMFNNALSSSRFRGNTSGRTDRLGDAFSANVDNPVDMMTKMVNDGALTREQAEQYLARLRATTFSGPIQ